MGGWRAGWLVVLGTMAAASEAGELTVKAMSFNIRLSRANDGPNNWSARCEMVGQVIRRFDGDFVGVQEAWPDQIGWLRDALPAYGCLVRSREANPRDGEAIPLLYRSDRWTLDPAEHGTFWLSDTPDKPGSSGWGNWIPRVVTWGRFVEKATGRGVYVFNVHLDHLSEQSRTKSGAMLARRIAARRRLDPVLVLGDFNSGETGAAVRRLTARDGDAPAPLVDTFRTLHPAAQAVGTFHAFGGGRDGAKIDYVLASPGARVLGAEIVYTHCNGNYPSDHFPVTAQVTFPESAGGRLPTGR